MHDHAGSLAAVHMVAGRLQERYLTSGGGSDTPSIETRWLEAGDTLQLPHDHNHEMINLDSEEAVSIHVYSPPLKDTDFRVDAEITLVTVPGR
jgi:quercetin dioxygenase-like cupin family protein